MSGTVETNYNITDTDTDHSNSSDSSVTAEAAAAPKQSKKRVRRTDAQLRADFEDQQRRVSAGEAVKITLMMCEGCQNVYTLAAKHRCGGTILDSDNDVRRSEGKAQWRHMGATSASESTNCAVTSVVTDDHSTHWSQWVAAATALRNQLDELLPRNASTLSGRSSAAPAIAPARIVGLLAGLDDLQSTTGQIWKLQGVREVATRADVAKLFADCPAEVQTSESGRGVHVTFLD